jgi:hypothetical protein
MSFILNSYRFGSGGSTATWNPADNNLTLTNGNLTASNGAGAWKATRGTSSASSGQKYYEVTCTGIITDNRVIFGVAKAAATLASYLGSDANGWGWQVGDAKRWNNGTSSVYGAGTLANGDVVGIFLDIDAGTLHWSLNGVSVGAAFTGLSGTFLPAVSIINEPFATARFASSTWTYSPGGTYTEWT